MVEVLAAQIRARLVLMVGRVVVLAEAQLLLVVLLYLSLQFQVKQQQFKVLLEAGIIIQTAHPVAVVLDNLAIPQEVEVEVDTVVLV